MVERWSLAFAAGMLAAINPCGFALLPAYLSYFLGLESKTASEDDPEAVLRGNVVVRALAVSAALTLGFILVFAPMGAAWSSLSSALGDRLPWVTAALGLGLVGLGIAMLRGFQPTVNLPKLQLGSTRRELGSMVLFGISYAVASLSCTIGVFGSLVTTTFRNASFLAGIGAFVAYALGMGLVIAVLTVAVSLARQGIVVRMKRLVPHMTRISGGLVILAGIYVAYYGWSEIRVNQGDLDAGGVASKVSEWQGRVGDWIRDVGPGWVGAGLVVVIAAAVAVSVRRSHHAS